MTRRSRAGVLVGALVLTLAAPALAQDATSSVHFDGVGFSFDHSLGRSVNILRVPRQPQDESQFGEASPALISFSLYGRQGEGRRVPRAWDVPGVVRVYRTTAFEGYPVASRQVARLEELLAGRPDPSTLESITADATTEMPYLPIDEAAAQAIAARIEYIDTPELSGVSYVTGFRQDTFPFARDDFWYTFQGLSTDGRWYVAASWVLRVDVFPEEVTSADAERVGRNARSWSRYIDQSVATLDAAEPTAFRPSLETLDALVRSIDFDSVVQATASPSLAPAPSDAVAASEAPSSPAPSSPAPSSPAPSPSAPSPSAPSPSAAP